MTTTTVAASKYDIAAAMKQMSPALREIYEQGLKRRVDLTRNGLLEKYEIGVDFIKVMEDEDKYGKGAAKVLAVAWDINESEVYQFRHMVLAWERKEFEKLIQRKTGVGGTIRLIHLVTLASITSASKRDSLTEKTFTQSLSFRELSALVQAKMGGKRSGGGRRSILPRSPSAGLAKLCKIVDGYIILDDSFEKSVFDKLAEQPGKYADADTLSQLQVAEERLSELSKMALDDKRKVTAAISTIGKMIQAADNKASKQPKATARTKISDETAEDDAPKSSPSRATNGHANGKKKSAATVAKAKRLKATKKKKVAAR